VRAAESVIPIAVQRALTEDAYLRTAVAMEVFFTEWIVRGASMDTAALRKTLEAKASNFTTAQLPNWRSLPSEYPATTRVSITIPPTIAQAKVRTLLNCEDDSVDDLYLSAKQNIADVRGTYVRKLTTEEARVVDATIAIRNYLVHRTERGRAALNTALRRQGMPPNLRRSGNLGSHDSVGRYLCTTPPGGRRRVEHLIETLYSIAVKLAPYKGAPVTLWP
jgi:hypothetical protein